MPWYASRMPSGGVDGVVSWSPSGSRGDDGHEVHWGPSTGEQRSEWSVQGSSQTFVLTFDTRTCWKILTRIPWMCMALRFAFSRRIQIYDDLWLPSCQQAGVPQVFACSEAPPTWSKACLSRSFPLLLKQVFKSLIFHQEFCENCLGTYRIRGSIRKKDWCLSSDFLKWNPPSREIGFKTCCISYFSPQVWFAFNDRGGSTQRKKCCILRSCLVHLVNIRDELVTLVCMFPLLFGLMGVTLSGHCSRFLQLIRLQDGSAESLPMHIRLMGWESGGMLTIACCYFCLQRPRCPNSLYLKTFFLLAISWVDTCAKLK